MREVLIFEKCPDIQYTHFSYDEYGGFDVKIIAQNHTFFAHRWDQIRSFLSMWSSCNTQFKNYSQLCRWAKIWRITNMSSNDAKKFIIFLISISILIFYTYFLRLLLSAGSSFLKSVLLVRIVSAWQFFLCSKWLYVNFTYFDQDIFL